MSARKLRHVRIAAVSGGIFFWSLAACNLLLDIREPPPTSVAGTDAGGRDVSVVDADPAFAELADVLTHSAADVGAEGDAPSTDMPRDPFSLASCLPPRTPSGGALYGCARSQPDAGFSCVPMKGGNLACGSDTDCSPGYYCEGGDGSPESGDCARLCRADWDTCGGNNCKLLSWPPVEVDGYELGVCFWDALCDLRSTESCAPEAGADAGTFGCALGNSTHTIRCTRMGNKTTTCSKNSDCRPGYACSHAGTSQVARCRRWCEVGGGDCGDADCLHSGIFANGIELGTCL